MSERGTPAAPSGEGFEPVFFPKLAELEAGNFWFRARNRLIIWAVGKYCPGIRSFLEIGCGTGYVLSGLVDAFPGTVFRGSEFFADGLVFAKARQPGVEFMQMDARDIPFAGEFDAIGAFDVIEHIKEDEQVLAQMHAALRPGGVVFITVPQHRWLWSAQDDGSHHERRYEKNELHGKVRGAGFEILRSSSFVSLLLPAMLLARVAKRKPDVNGIDLYAEFRIPRWMNAAFEWVMSAELALIRLGMDWPLGGSRLLVARKAPVSMRPIPSDQP